MSANVHTEWQQLKEVIVGNVVNTNLDANIDITFELFYHQNIKDKLIKSNRKLQRRLIEQRQEDLDNLATVLKDLGVKVKRPRVLDAPKEFIAPNFKSSLHPSDNPRDLVMIVGNKIIETPVLTRSRYFETDLLKPILFDYFSKGSRWISAPRPTLSEASFDYSYVKNDDIQSRWQCFTEKDSELEIMFDAAQCLKFGEDIIMNVSTKNHKLGAEWLARELGERYRLHLVSITDHHIDGMFMPLAPGKLLINPTTMESKIHLLPKELQKWDIIRCTEIENSKYSDDVLLTASENISVNVLPINEQLVLLFSSTGEGLNDLRKKLKKNGIESIMIKLRHSKVFDGGIHCATLDTVREGNLEKYF